ncbi:MAG TPA: tyrosine-type recombinase/integrase [Gemmatimonadales bacterium]|nr:tyrosine-type recombinase/integrase [Gemmatimonadales bacterium]
MTVTTEQRPRTKRRERERWSWAVGEYGGRVLVFQERNGRLYGQIRGKRVALKHTDRDRAKTWAKDQERQLREGLATAADPTPTVAKVFAAYQAARAELDLSGTSRYTDERCGGRLPDPTVPGDEGDPGLFARVLGADRDLSKLTLGEWQHFIRVRLTGAVDAWGRDVPMPATAEDQPRRVVRARTVEADCEWLAIVCNWALEWEDRETGRPLLREHPFKRERFRDAVPHEQNPRRPVATQDRYEAILAKAPAVHPFLAALLGLVNGTGRRIRAVLSLRYQDLQLAKSPATPHGAVQWPGETDKMGKAWAAPINAAVRATLDALLGERPGLGAAYLFPSPSDVAQPMDRWFASKLLRRAERLAKVPKHNGSLWHAYRRKWGTERKHLPVQDVAQAGGWKNTATLETIYQQPDAATLYRVVSEPAELREAKA